MRISPQVFLFPHSGVRLGRANSEEQIGEILDEAKKEGLERDSVVAQSAAQRRNKLNTSATNGS